FSLIFDTYMLRKTLSYQCFKSSVGCNRMQEKEGRRRGWRKLCGYALLDFIAHFWMQCAYHFLLPLTLTLLIKRCIHPCQSTCYECSSNIISPRISMNIKDFAAKE